MHVIVRECVVCMCVSVREGRKNKALLTHFMDEDIIGVTNNGTLVVLVSPRNRI